MKCTIHFYRVIGKLLIISLFIFLFLYISFWGGYVVLSINLCTAQNKPLKVTDTPYYQTAYTEITDMLEGRIPIDFKRVVFLPEWAYLRGNLSYEKYCKEIDSIYNKT